MDFALQLLRLVGSLALVLALFLALMYGLKRWGYLVRKSSAQPSMEVVSKHSFGPRHTRPHSAVCDETLPRPWLARAAWLRSFADDTLRIMLQPPLLSIFLSVSIVLHRVSSHVLKGNLPFPSCVQKGSLPFSLSEPFI